MIRRLALIALPVAALAALILIRRPASEPVTPLAAAGVVHVIKSPTCGCCTAWVDYMRKEGFTVTVEDREQPFTDLKRTNGITAELESCHTAFIDGLAIEGHVPADLIRKALADRAGGESIKGLSTPGMPMGSPGMEGPYKDPYTVFAFDSTGRITPYAER